MSFHISAMLKESSEANRHRRRREEEEKNGDIAIGNKLLMWVDSAAREESRKKVKVPVLDNFVIQRDSII